MTPKQLIESVQTPAAALLMKGVVHIKGWGPETLRLDEVLGLCALADMMYESAANCELETKIANLQSENDRLRNELQRVKAQRDSSTEALETSRANSHKIWVELCESAEMRSQTLDKLLAVEKELKELARVWEHVKRTTIDENATAQQQLQAGNHLCIALDTLLKSR